MHQLPASNEASPKAVRSPIVVQPCLASSQAICVEDPCSDESSQLLSSNVSTNSNVVNNYGHDETNVVSIDDVPRLLDMGSTGNSFAFINDNIYSNAGLSLHNSLDASVSSTSFVYNQSVSSPSALKKSFSGLTGSCTSGVTAGVGTKKKCVSFFMSEYNEEEDDEEPFAESKSSPRISNSHNSTDWSTSDLASPSLKPHPQFQQLISTPSPSPAYPSPIPSLQDRIRVMLTRYAPHKLPHLPGQLATLGNDKKEAELLAELVRRYGPEPSYTDDSSSRTTSSSTPRSLRSGRLFHSPHMSAGTTVGMAATQRSEKLRAIRARREALDKEISEHRVVIAKAKEVLSSMQARAEQVGRKETSDR